MRIIIYIYLVIYFLSVLANIFMWIKTKGHKLLLLFEIITAFYLMFITFIYFTPTLYESFNFYWGIPVVPFALVDIYLSVWGKDDLICPPETGFSKNDLEIARILSVVFIAPAYISGFLFLLEKLGS